MVYFEPHNNVPCDDSVSSTFTVVCEIPDKTTTTTDVRNNNNDTTPRRPSRPQEEDAAAPQKAEHRISSSLSSCFSSSSSTDGNSHKPPRNVHFLEQAEMRLIPTCMEMEDHEIDAVWYSVKDHVNMKNRAKALALESRRGSGGRHSIHMLDQCYPMAKQASSDKKNDTLSLCHRHPYQFEHWARSAMGVRGLEHWISKDHCMTRFQQKNEVRQAVLETSKMGDETEIARAAQEQSASSRLLAVWVGHADAQFRVGPHDEAMLEEEILQDYHQEQEQKKRLHQELFGTTEFGKDDSEEEEQSESQSDFSDQCISDKDQSQDEQDEEEDEELAERRINPQSVGCTVTYHRRPKPRAFLRNMLSSEGR